MAQNELIKAGIKVITAVFSAAFAGKVAKEGQNNYSKWQSDRASNGSQKLNRPKF